MKKLYKLILISYLGPFVATFFIAVFILLMQFLWKYVDDIVGKGLEWYVVVQLLTYASASLVPMALPLSILLSSIMTFGNLGEHYELVAMKSAGISLQKIMAPLVIVSILVSIGAFFFSNNALPYANLKMGSLLYDIRQQRPSFSLKEGVFYNGIEGYIIKVSQKDDDGQTLHGIMIYDHTTGSGNPIVITAQSGKMMMSADKRYLIFSLNNGYSFEELQNEREYAISFPMVRNEFKEQTIRFDLSSFKFIRSDQELFKDNYQMLNVSQLKSAEDTLTRQYNQRKDGYIKNFPVYFPDQKDSIKKAPTDNPMNFTEKNFLLNINKENRMKVLEAASNLARSSENYIAVSTEDLDIREKTIIRHKIEWHRKFTLSFACLVLFFIGAPLGAIIRKGGLGMPVFMSTIFFVTFHLLSITGEKIAREGVASPAVGMWMASFILLPMGIFLTIKATKDSALFDVNVYSIFFKKIFTSNSKKKA